jgi:hypothetical protein
MDRKFGHAAGVDWREQVRTQARAMRDPARRYPRGIVLTAMRRLGTLTGLSSGH